MNSKKLSWETFDHIKQEKSEDWFWIVGIVAVSIAVLSVFFNNILLALIILLGAFTSFMAAHAKPKNVQYEINRKGVKVGEILYPYSVLESFCVIDEDGYDRDRLLLRSRKAFMPIITVPLAGEVENDSVREYLLEYLNEEEMQEPWTEILASRLGF
jgi:hypothetical protein